MATQKTRKSIQDIVRSSSFQNLENLVNFNGGNIKNKQNSKEFCDGEDLVGYAANTGSIERLEFCLNFVEEHDLHCYSSLRKFRWYVLSVWTKKAPEDTFMAGIALLPFDTIEYAHTFSCQFLAREDLSMGLRLAFFDQCISNGFYNERTSFNIAKTKNMDLIQSCFLDPEETEFTKMIQSNISFDCFFSANSLEVLKFWFEHFFENDKNIMYMCAVELFKNIEIEEAMEIFEYIKMDNRITFNAFNMLDHINAAYFIRGPLFEHVIEHLKTFINS
jgi:hypothetical protein